MFLCISGLTSHKPTPSPLHPSSPVTPTFPTASPSGLVTEIQVAQLLLVSQENPELTSAAFRGRSPQCLGCIHSFFCRETRRHMHRTSVLCHRVPSARAKTSVRFQTPRAAPHAGNTRDLPPAELAELTLLSAVTHSEGT